MFTVNNHRIEAGLVPPLFFIIFCALFLNLFTASGTVRAQKINKYYVSFKQAKGTLFFIRPQKGFKSTPNHSHFTYDMTCISGSDSLSLNFSYFDKTPRALDSLALLIGPKRRSSSLQKIFIETKKSYWHYRFTTRLAVKDVEAFFNLTEGALFQLIEKESVIGLDCKKRKWKKNSQINRKIFQLIRYNN